MNFYRKICLVLILISITWILGIGIYKEYFYVEDRIWEFLLDEDFQRRSYEKISIVKLITDAHPYVGEKLVVTGILQSTGGRRCLYLSKEDRQYEVIENSIQLSYFDESFTDEELIGLARLDGTTVSVWGEFDVQYSGYDKLERGVLKDIKFFDVPVDWTF